MITNRLIRIIGFICLSWALSIAANAGLIRDAAAQHAGHGGGAPQAQSQPAAERSAVQADPREESPTVEIPIEKQHLMGVKIGEVAVRSRKKTIRTAGRVEFNEKKLVTINTKFEGWIEKLHVDYTGMQVKQGDPLAEIYSPELFATQQEFINLIKWKVRGRDSGDEQVNAMLTQDSDVIVEAVKQRLKLWDITEEQIARIAESGKPLRTLTLYSPVDGTVLQKNAFQGMRIMPGEKLFDIVDLSTVWIIAEIYENELPLVHEGDRALIRLSSLPGRALSARIEYIAPTLSGETRTVKVRFSLPNPDGLLKPQMFTNVEIDVNAGKRLAVPEDAVIDTGERQLVYVDAGDGYFEPRVVKLGFRGDGYSEVLKGVRAGEKVARSATFLIDSEAQLKGVR